MNMENEREEIAMVFKALGDLNRLLIVEQLQNGEECACNLLDNLNIVQSTLSYHMKTLCESGLVNCRRDGKWMYYSLNKQGCERAYRLLTKIMESPVQNIDYDKCTCE